MREEELERLRAIVRDCVGRHEYASATFYAGRVALATGDPTDIYMEAQALLLAGHHRRALHLLTSSPPLLRDLRFRCLAAKCLVSDEYVETDCTMRSENGGSKNVIILQGILKYLEDIGILHANRMLDEEEVELLNKIEKKVASAVEFFYSAMAYRQRGMIQPSLSSDGIVEVGGQMNEKVETNHHLIFDSLDGYRKFFELLLKFKNLKRILEAIKKGLMEKPIRQEVKKNMLCSMNCSMQNEVCRDTCFTRRLRLASKKHIDW